MGQARKRGSFEERKAQALKSGRIKPGQQIEIDPARLKDVLCPNCGFNLFTLGTEIKKMSRLLPENPTGEDQYIHHQVGAVCIKCSQVLPDKP